jgi:hypothetical protein
VNEDDNTIGFGKVIKGTIDTLEFDPSEQSYSGHILSAILSQIVSEADRHRANLSIALVEMDGDLKYILERFGFRLTNGTVMKRLAGSIVPTSVGTTAGMSNKINESALERQEMIMGLSQWVNHDIGLVGGGRAGGASDAGETRLRYDIYDMVDIDMDHAADYKVGYVDVNVDDKTNDIVGLVNIEITKRRGGIGRRVIDALLDTVGELKIYDIQKSARKFWEAMGIEYDGDPNHPIGSLNGVIKR